LQRWGRSVAFEEAVMLTLREAAACYVVNREGGPVPLVDDLETRYSSLTSNWPCRGRTRRTEGSEVLAALLSSARSKDDLEEHLREWLDDAQGFLRLDACLADAQPGQTAPEFFQDLARQLEADRLLWLERAPHGRPPKLPTQLPLEPAPKPISLLTELQRAGTEAETAAALNRVAAAGLRCYLEAALERHWMRICGETSLLKDLMGEAVHVDRVEAKIRADDGHARHPNVATVDVRFDRDDFDFQVRLPFHGRTGDGTVSQSLTTQLLIRGARPARAPKRVAARYADRLQLHLNDMRWSLDRYCQHPQRLTIGAACPEEPAHGHRDRKPTTAQRPAGSDVMVSVHHPERQVESIPLRHASAAGEKVEFILHVFPSDADVEIEGCPVELDKEGTIAIRGRAGQRIDVRAQRDGYCEIHENITLSSSACRIELVSARRM